MTKFYFHNATSGISGTLPSAEQSSLTVTSGCNYEGSQTTNRSMNTTVGTSMVNLNLNITMATTAKNFYVTRFVSPLINQTSIAANTWTYSFSARESSGFANFPVNGTNKSVWINVYVWRPSTGAKVGTILDGTTAATVDEGASGSNIAHVVSFTGSAVAGLTAGDAVIIAEIWFQVTGGTTAGASDHNFYYDGTTEHAENATATSMASYISTPETISFSAAGNNIVRSLPTETVTVGGGTLTRIVAKIRTRSETVTISESRARLAQKNRAIPTQTVAISENIVRTKGKPRAPPTQTVTIGESVARQIAKNRTRSETVTVGESLTRQAMKNRPLQTETVTVTGGIANRIKGSIKNLPQTVAISENLARLTNKNRAVPTQTVTISEQRARQAMKARTLSTETVSVGAGTVQKLKGSVRTLTTEIITIGESISRQTNKTRIIIQTVVISDSATRLAAKMRALASQTVVIGDSLARLVEHEAGGVVRSLIETVIVSDSLTRQKSANRALEETTTTSESVDRVKGTSKSLAESVSITESLGRIKQATRMIAETVETSEAVQRMAAKIRTFVETVTASDAVQQFKETPAQHIVRALTEIVNVSDLLNRMVAKARSIIETVPITDSLQGAKNDEPFGVFVPGGGTSGTGADTGYTTTKKSVAAIVVIKLPQLMVTAKSITIPKLVNIRVLPRPRIVQRSPVVVKYVERVVEKQAATLPTREVQAMKPFTAQIVSPHLKVSSIITKLPEVRVTAHHLTTQKEIRDRKHKLLKIIGLGYLLDKLD